MRDWSSDFRKIELQGARQENEYAEIQDGISANSSTRWHLSLSGKYMAKIDKSSTCYQPQSYNTHSLCVPALDIRCRLMY